MSDSIQNNHDPASPFDNTKDWKTPDEIIRLYRLKKKQKALYARLGRPASSSSQPIFASTSLSEPTTSRGTQKRKNPFVQTDNESVKRSKFDKIPNDDADFSKEDSIFSFLSAPQTYQSKIENEPKYQNVSQPIIGGDDVPQPQQQRSFADILAAGGGSLSATAANHYNNEIYLATDENEKLPEDGEKPTAYVPIDWSLNTRIRILSSSPILMGNSLKTNQEASGITSFVRCLDSKTSSTGLDISLGAQFHQSTLYWQHPNLPWLTMFPRNAKSNNGFQIGEQERVALAADWSNSFRSLFQLLRARQCPYFYVCANTFTVLFRAAGVGGRVEQHAFLTPTSRGMRAALKQEEIEFTLPLKGCGTSATKQKNHSFDSGVATNPQNSSSFSNSIEIDNDPNNDDDDDDDDDDQEKWLASLGVDDSEIKKINSINARAKRSAECEDDFSDHSIVLVEGVECQAFFNFLLNSKSSTTKVGRMAGVPPTLLAPVCFPGASLKQLQLRTSKVRVDAGDFNSIELKGVILPHILQYLCRILRDTKDLFSATMTSQPSTMSFSKAAQQLIQDLDKENGTGMADHVFGRENLSDCGLPAHILEAMCRVSNDAVRNLARMCYNKENGGYTWSQS